MSTRESLQSVLKKYHSSYSEEKTFAKQFLTLLENPRCFFRDHLPGHVTGSSWIVDKSKKFVLLTHHAKLNRWLQPGGHADGDEDVIAVATREAEEETGLKSIRLLSNEIFDIDIHPIPARKDFPEHDHYDIRFLFEASKEEPFTITEESNDLKWIHIDDLSKVTHNNISMMRMAEKVAAISS